MNERPLSGSGGISVSDRNWVTVAESSPGADARLRPLTHGSILARNMHVERAYAERESLSDHDLERLRASLVDQVQRYEDAIRGYPPDKMEKYGQPFLAFLRQKIADVDADISARESGS